MDDGEDWDLELLDRIILHAEQENKARRAAAAQPALRKSHTDASSRAGNEFQGLQQQHRSTNLQEHKAGTQLADKSLTLVQQLTPHVLQRKQELRSLHERNGQEGAAHNHVQGLQQPGEPARGSSITGLVRHTLHPPAPLQQDPFERQAVEPMPSLNGHKGSATALQAPRVVSSRLAHQQGIQHHAVPFSQQSTNAGKLNQRQHGSFESTVSVAMKHQPKLTADQPIRYLGERTVERGGLHYERGAGQRAAAAVPSSDARSLPVRGEQGTGYKVQQHEAGVPVWNNEMSLSGLQPSIAAKSSTFIREEFNDTAIADVDLIRSELQFLKKTLAEKDGAVSILRARLSQADLELSELRKTVREGLSTEDLKRQAADLQREVERLNAQLAFKEEELSQSKKLRSEKEAELGDLMTSRATIQKQLNDLQQQRGDIAGPHSHGHEGRTDTEVPPAIALNGHSLNNLSAQFQRTTKNCASQGEIYQLTSVRGSQLASKQVQTGVTSQREDVWSPPFLPELWSANGVESEKFGRPNEALQGQPKSSSREDVRREEFVSEGKVRIEVDRGVAEAPSESPIANGDLPSQRIVTDTAHVLSPPNFKPEIPVWVEHASAITQAMEQTSRQTDIRFLEVQRALQRIWKPEGRKAEGAVLIEKLFAFCQREMSTLLAGSTEWVVGGEGLNIGRRSRKGREGGREREEVGGQERRSQTAGNINSSRGSGGDVQMGTSLRLSEVLASVINGLLPSTAFLEPLLDVCECEERADCAAIALRAILQLSATCRQAILQEKEIRSSGQAQVERGPHGNGWVVEQPYGAASNERSVREGEACPGQSNATLPKFFSSTIHCVRSTQHEGSSLRDHGINEDGGAKSSEERGFTIGAEEDRAGCEAIMKRKRRPAMEMAVHEIEMADVNENKEDVCSRFEESGEGDELMGRRRKESGQVASSSLEGQGAVQTTGDMGGLLERVVKLAMGPGKRKNVQEEAAAMLVLLVAHGEPIRAGRLLRNLLSRGVVNCLLKTAQATGVRLQAIRLLQLLVRFNLNGPLSLTEKMDYWTSRPNASETGSGGDKDDLTLLNSVAECLVHPGSNDEDRQLRLGAVRLFAVLMDGLGEGDVKWEALVGVAGENEANLELQGKENGTSHLSSEDQKGSGEANLQENSAREGKVKGREAVAVKLLKLIEIELNMKSRRVPESSNTDRELFLRDAMSLLCQLASHAKHGSTFWSSLANNRSMLLLCLEISSNFVSQAKGSSSQLKASSLFTMLQRFRQSALRYWQEKHS